MARRFKIAPLLVAGVLGVFGASSAARAAVVYDLTLAGSNPATPDVLVLTFSAVPTNGQVSGGVNTADFTSLKGTVDGITFNDTSIGSLDFFFTGGVLTAITGTSTGDNGHNGTSPTVTFSLSRGNEVYDIDHNQGNDPSSGVTIALAVPEPSTWAMMILGFLGLGFMAVRKAKKKSALSFA
jgi:PEP-CTERM motif